ncbi:14002_t:CDS:2, partial [Ambispora leptoticha]
SSLFSFPHVKMDEPTNLFVATSPKSASVPRTMRITNYKNYTSPLTEENLKLHAMLTPPREAKSHHVLSYVDLQRQLVALEAQLKREAEAAQAKFNSALPENTPPVIPEKKSQRIKSIGKKLVRKISFNLEKKNHEDAENNKIYANHDTTERINQFNSRSLPSSPRSANFQQNHPSIKDSISIRLEKSTPASPDQPNSRASSNIPIKRIFIRKAGSADITNPMSSVHNNSPYAPLSPSHLSIESTSIISPSRPTSPPAPLQQQQQQRPAIVSAENRDSGISLVAPMGNHSRDNSSSLLRRVGNFSTFKEREGSNKSSTHSQQTIKKNKSRINDSSSRNHEIELLAFRYPSVEKSNDLNTPMTNNDSDEAGIHYTALGNVGSRSESGFGIDSDIAVAASNPIPIHIPTIRLQDDIDESPGSFDNYKNISNGNKNENLHSTENKFKEKENEWSASFDYDIIQSHLAEYDENGLPKKKKTHPFRLSTEKFSVFQSNSENRRTASYPASMKNYKTSNNSERHNNHTNIDQFDILPTPAVIVE